MNRRTGLSLFELLLALALLTFIAGGIAAALRLGVRLHDRSAALSQTAGEVALRLRLRNLVAAAAPPTLLAPFPRSFEGEPRRLAFTTLAAAGAFPAAAALRIEVFKQDAVLLLRLQEMADDGTVTKTTDSQLANGISDLRFSYFDAESDPPAWRDDWEHEARLPDLVRIEAAPGSLPDWPEFTVRPRLGG